MADSFSKSGSIWLHLSGEIVLANVLKFFRKHESYQKESINGGRKHCIFDNHLLFILSADSGDTWSKTMVSICR